MEGGPWSPLGSVSAPVCRLNGEMEAEPEVETGPSLLGGGAARLALGPLQTESPATSLLPAPPLAPRHPLPGIPWHPGTPFPAPPWHPGTPCPAPPGTPVPPARLGSD